MVSIAGGSTQRPCIFWRSAVLAGALDELNRQETPNFEKSIFLRPVPQVIPQNGDRQEYYNQYRTDLVTQAGACVFIAGLKEENGNLVTANGVLNEFDIAAAADRIPIPIASTGGAALEIWHRVDANYQRFLGNMPRELFDALNRPGLSPEIGLRL